MSTQNDVLQVVNLIGQAYPNFSPTRETVGVYYELLKDLPVDLLKAAALQCCAEAGRKFAPSVGEIRGAAVALQVKAQGIPSILEAWDEVCRAPYRNISESHPFYSGGKIYTSDPNPHIWSHPLVEKVARLMGWPDFPDPENESVDRAHFFRQYDAELLRYTSNEIELPEVRRYIEDARTNQPIKQLTKGMEK